MRIWLIVFIIVLAKESVVGLVDMVFVYCKLSDWYTILISVQNGETEEDPTDTIALDILGRLESRPVVRLALDRKHLTNQEGI